MKAFVVATPSTTPSPELVEELREHVRRRLAAYEVPRAIEFVDAIPMTVTGKLRRSELRNR